jgi:CheY-like chemotaxis protein
VPRSTDPSRPIRVLLVDDDAENRRTLRDLLEGWELVVVGEAGDGVAAIELATELGPDVVLMDVRMPVMDGIEAAGLITDSVPRSRVILLTSDDEPALQRRAEEQGVAACLLKHAPDVDIRDAILQAVQGPEDT